MGIWEWFCQGFTNAGKIQARYKRGMRRAQARDYDGALHDYDAVISSPDSMPELKFMARYNRAIAHVASGNATIGVEELSLIAADGDTPVNVRTAARQKLIRINQAASNSKR